VTGLLIAASIGYLLIGYLLTSRFGGIERGNDRFASSSRAASDAAAQESPSTPSAEHAQESASTPSAEPDEASIHAPWLDVLNRYRASVGVGAVRSNPELSTGAALHSRYLLRNYGDDVRRGTNLGSLMHSEDPAKPLFTKEGLAAGKAGDVEEMWGSGKTPPGWAIDDWMRGPFHRLSLLSPYLHSVGYGDGCDKGVCIATLNVLTDVDPMPRLPRPLEVPLVYPPRGASIPAIGFEAEWPNPLTSCPGYAAADAGLPVTIQLGPLVSPGLSRMSVSLNGATPVAIETCVFDANTYTNPDEPTQRLGRDILSNYGAIVIIPRRQMGPGVYTAAVVAGGRDLTWSFSIKP
jgi:uncharacterized protein YkwD